MTSLIALSLDLELFVAVDNNIEIFADGLRLGEHHGWSVGAFSLPANASVLAFNASKAGGPGADRPGLLRRRMTRGAGRSVERAHHRPAPTENGARYEDDERRERERERDRPRRPP